MEHRLTDAQISILRVALGGHRPAPGRRASAPIRDCEALAALNLIELRAGVCTSTPEGARALREIEEGS